MSLRGRLLREHSLSLVKAVELSKASEIAKEQLHKLEKGERKTSKEVNFVRSKHTQWPKARVPATQPKMSAKHKRPEFFTEKVQILWQESNTQQERRLPSVQSGVPQLSQKESLRRHMQCQDARSSKRHQGRR